MKAELKNAVRKQMIQNGSKTDHLEHLGSLEDENPGFFDISTLLTLGRLFSQTFPPFRPLEELLTSHFHGFDAWGSV